MAKEFYTQKKTHGRFKGNQSNIRQPIGRLRRSPYLFRVRLNKWENGDMYGDLPDVIRPFGDDGRWLVMSNGFAVYPFKINGSFKEGLGIDISCIQCAFEKPDILNVSFAGYMGFPASTGNVEMPTLLFTCLRNGETAVVLSILDPDGSGKLLYRKEFTVIVENPALPGGGFLGDVRVVGVDL